MDPVSSCAQIIVWLLALLILYNIVFRSFVGSKGNKIGSTKGNKIPEPCGALPLIGHLHLLGGRDPIFRTLSVMAKKNGSIFSLRLGFHKTLVVSSREIAKECLTTNDKTFASRPNIAAGRYMLYNNAFFALAPYGQYWRDMRKMATLELLSIHRLEQLKHVRDNEIYSFVKDLYTSYALKHMSDGDGDPIQVDISKLFEHLTFNISVQMIAGKRFLGETIGQEDSDARRLKRAIKDATYLSGVFVEADAIPFLGWFDFQGYVSSMKRTAKEIDFVLHKWMDEHLRKRAENQNGTCEINDFMDVLASTFEGHDEICGHRRDIVIKATALTLILTSSGSTSITLTWALSLLLNHPRALKAAQEELDTNIGKQKWVQESDIKDLKYLQSIIKETLRLYPPAPLTGIRESTEDCIVTNYHIPKGTRLLINIWELQRDPQIWQNPDEFQPERFLTTHSEIDFRGQNFEYIPFSSGRRSCPGITFGLQVVHLTLARLLQGFDVYTKNGYMIDMIEGLGLALPKKNPLEIVLKPRLPLELYHGI